MKQILNFCLLLFFLQSFFVFAENASLAADVYVGSPNVKKIRIAIPNFAVASDSSMSPKRAEDMTRKLNSMLEFTNWFEMIPQSAFVASKNAPLEPIQFPDWDFIKAEYVVLGSFIHSAKENVFHLELRLYNVRTKSLVAGKSYANLNLKTSYIALKRFGDVLVEAATGIPGPFMSQIAFIGRKNPDTPYSSVYIADFDGSHAQAISNGQSIHISPSWSPDGKKLTYTSFISGKPEIYQYNLLTKKTFRMTNGEGNHSGSTWSPDGNTIAFSSSDMNGHTHIYTMNSLGGGTHPFIANNEIEVEPAYSPNGKYIAYTSNKYGKPMLFTKNLQNNEITRITYTGWYNASASWSPDSLHIVYASYDRDIDRWDLFKIKYDGSEMERLTLKEGDNERPTWSPDGRFILFQTDRGLNGENVISNKRKLFIMSSDGLYKRNLNISLPDIRQPTWGPRIDQIYLAD